VVVTARIAAGLCGLVVVIGFISLRAGIRRARLDEIQLGTNPADVQAVIRDGSVQQAGRRALAIDYFFLTAYWAAFVTLAVLVFHRGGLWIVPAVAAWITATATAALDVAENLRTTAILNLGRRGAHLERSELDGLRHVSLAKWAASALTVALLSAVYARHGWWSVGAVAVFLLVAIVGLAGLYRHALIQRFLSAVAVISFGTAIALPVDPTIVR
jgi:hypothetical protein